MGHAHLELSAHPAQQRAAVRLAGFQRLGGRRVGCIVRLGLANAQLRRSRLRPNACGQAIAGILGPADPDIIKKIALGPSEVGRADMREGHQAALYGAMTPHGSSL